MKEIKQMEVNVKISCSDELEDLVLLKCPHCTDSLY